MGPRSVALAAALALAGCAVAPRLGDPIRLPVEDPRAVACGIPRSEMWMAFSMARARDFQLHFPGWSEGVQELEVDDPALVIIGPGVHRGFGGDELSYDMCIAVGPPSEAILHRYAGIRFDAVRPELGGPPVPMP